MEAPYLDSGFLSEEDKHDIVNAMAELSMLQEHGKIIFENSEKNERFYFMTLIYLQYEGTISKKQQLLAMAKAWGDLGQNTIAKALFIRVQEAMDIEAEQKKQESGFNFLELPIDIEEKEEAPITQRSRVAKLLGYSTIFCKLASGK